MKIYSHFTPKSLVLYKYKVNFEVFLNKSFEKIGFSKRRSGVYCFQLKR